MTDSSNIFSAGTSKKVRAAGSRSWLGAIILFAAAMFTTALAGPGGTITVNWFSVDGGGGTVMIGTGAGGNIEITGTAGQADAGTMFSIDNSIEITGGFGAAIASGQATWTGGTNGNFTQPSFWDEGVAPDTHDTVIFDFATPLVLVNFTTSPTIGRLFVFDNLQFNFNNTDLFLQDDSATTPSLVIGRLPTSQIPFVRLKIQNAGGTPHGLQALSTSIGDAAGSTGILQVDGATARFSNNGTLWVGHRCFGELEISAGAQATSTGPINIASFTSNQPLDGHVTLHDANSKWITQGANPTTDDFVIGDVGIAKLEVRNGAIMTTSNFRQVVVGKSSNSFGEVLITGATSKWQINQPLITVGAGGTGHITVDAGGTIENPFGFVPTIALGHTGGLSGKGTIHANVLSFGQVQPGLGENGNDNISVQTGQLTIDGSYEQIGNTQVSGSLRMRIGGNTPGATYDVLQVTGQARFGGGLFVELLPNYSPSGNFQIIQANNVVKPFDVAFLPGLNNSFFRVNYPASDGIAGPGGVTMSVLGLSSLLNFNSGTFGLNGVPNSVVVGAFNADQFDDLAISVSHGSSNGEVFICLNTGSGVNFTVQQVTVGVDPGPITVGAFDNNGSIDIAVANRRDSVLPGTVNILTNNGNGSFAVAGSPITVGVKPSSIAAGVLHASMLVGGPADLVVTNFNSNTATLLFNNGSGNFNPGQTPIQTGVMPIVVNPADVDNDRNLDLCIVNEGDGNVSIYHGNGFGGFNPPTNYSVGNLPVAMIASTLNSDSLPDLAIINSADNSVSVLVNNSSAPGTFAPAVNLQVGTNPRSIAVADLDGDNDIDVAVLANEGNQRKVQILRNDTPATPGSPLALALKPNSPSVDANSIAVVSGNMDSVAGRDIISISDGGGALAANGALSVLLNATTSSCIGDVAPAPAGNHAVNVDDLLAVINGWGLCPAPPAICRADIAPPGGNGFVNVDDLLAVINHWGPCP